MASRYQRQSCSAPTKSSNRLVCCGALCPLLTQSGHQWLRIAAVQPDCHSPVSAAISWPHRGVLFCQLSAAKGARLCPRTCQACRRGSSNELARDSFTSDAAVAPIVRCDPIRQGRAITRRDCYAIEKQSPPLPGHEPYCLETVLIGSLLPGSVWRAIFQAEISSRRFRAQNGRRAMKIFKAAKRSLKTCGLAVIASDPDKASRTGCRNGWV